MVYKKGLGI